MAERKAKKNTRIDEDYERAERAEAEFYSSDIDDFGNIRRRRN